MSDQLSDFNKLMRDAVAIKSAQLSKTRKKFDTWPQFHQAGLYYSDSYMHIRDSPLQTKLQEFHKKKQEGTQIFQSGEYQKALHRYQQSLTVFRWVQSCKPNWKNQGIQDTDLTLHQQELVGQVAQAQIACYLNIALCNMKLEVWKQAVQACDQALKIDPDNVKGLYRKAMALTLPAGSSLDDYKQAIGILSKAIQLDPQNVGLRKKRQDFALFLKQQRVKSKETFHSFFKKPTYTDAQPQKQENPMKEINGLIKQAEVRLKDFKAKGQKQEAIGLRKTLQQLKTHKKEAIQKAREQAKPQIDFDNPSEFLKEEAEKFGLDLNDPAVKAELIRIKNETLGIQQEKVEEVVEEEKGRGYWYWLLGGVAVVAFLVYLLYPEPDPWPY